MQKCQKLTDFRFYLKQRRRGYHLRKYIHDLKLTKKTVLKIGLHDKSIFNTVVCQKTLFDLLRYDMSESSADFNLLYNSLHFLQILENLAMKSIAID